MIELTERQALAVAAQTAPSLIVDPRTDEVCVPIRKDVYDLACKTVGGGKGRVWDDEADDELIRKPA